MGQAFKEAKMSFAVGQNIVHPAHGAGTIVEFQEQELVDGHEEYFVIRFDEKRLTVRVPAERVEELGLRRVMGVAKCQEVLRVLGAMPTMLPSNFKERREVVEKLIHSGRPLKIAEAVRELMWRQELKRLNKADTEQFSQARAMLVEEMAIAMESEPAEVRAAIDGALHEAVATQGAVVTQAAVAAEAAAA
jgi:CarD family transcriptional regulator